MSIFKSFPAIFLVLFLVADAQAQTNLLRQKIEQFLAGKNATVGVAINGPGNGDTMTINNALHFPMQSVFKFHIALAVLQQVDLGKLKLTQKVFIGKEELMPHLWSPLREKYPGGNKLFPLDTLLAYTVSQSDNVGCDMLLKLIGGPSVVNQYIHSIGIHNTLITASETQMQKEWNVQFNNWTTPEAANSLLKLFYEKKLLSAKSQSFLWKLMTETSTGPDRIKGQLPAGTSVAHKTGTSGTNDQGITAAVNDIGIVLLPNGKRFIISVLVSNSKENDKANAAIIAGVTKIAWDYFVSNTK